MARYTNLFTTSASKEEVHQRLLTALKTCDLDLVYQDPVYIVAKEKPGHVTLAQLATVEILLNPPAVEPQGAKIDLIVRNEELPLRQDNHCHTIFIQVNQAISEVSAQGVSV